MVHITSLLQNQHAQALSTARAALQTKAQNSFQQLAAKQTSTSATVAKATALSTARGSTGSAAASSAEETAHTQQLVQAMMAAAGIKAAPAMPRRVRRMRARSPPTRHWATTSSRRWAFRAQQMVPMAAWTAGICWPTPAQPRPSKLPPTTMPQRPTPILRRPTLITPPSAASPTLPDARPARAGPYCILLKLPRARCAASWCFAPGVVRRQRRSTPRYEGMMQRASR